MRTLLFTLTAFAYAGEPPPRWVSLGEIDTNTNEIFFVVVTGIKTSEQLGMRLVAVTAIESNNNKYNGINFVCIWNRNPTDWDSSQERGLTIQNDSKIVVNIGDKYVIALPKDDVITEKVNMAAYQGQGIYKVTTEEWVGRRANVVFNRKNSVFK